MVIFLNLNDSETQNSKIPKDNLWRPSACKTSLSIEVHNCRNTSALNQVHQNDPQNDLDQFKVKSIPYMFYYVKMSLFWSVRMEWNKLDVSLRESGDLKIFKSKPRRQLNSPSMLVPIYNKTTGEGSVHHARMRMGLSSLNAHR